ncbi:MAG: hypothetical protein ABGY75_07635, partial [Gemmataceae bacterium]
MLNTKTLAVIVGALSLALGLWAVIGDTASMGMAEGAVGFVAVLIAPPTTETGTNGVMQPASTAVHELDEVDLSTGSSGGGHPAPAGPTDEADPMTFLDPAAADGSDTR